MLQTCQQQTLNQDEPRGCTYKSHILKTCQLHNISKNCFRSMTSNSSHMNMHEIHWYITIPFKKVHVVHTTFYARLPSSSLHTFLYHCIKTDPTAVQNWNHVTRKTAAISLNYGIFLFCLMSFVTCNCYCTVHMNVWLGGLC